MKKSVVNIFSLLSVLFLLWIVFSFVEVILKNNNENSTYIAINFFQILKNIL